MLHESENPMYSSRPSTFIKSLETVSVMTELTDKSLSTNHSVREKSGMEYNIFIQLCPRLEGYKRYFEDQKTCGPKNKQITNQFKIFFDLQSMVFFCFVFHGISIFFCMPWCFFICIPWYFFFILYAMVFFLFVFHGIYLFAFFISQSSVFL